jgi:hypothetical protein
MKMEATRSSETSVYNKPTWIHIPEHDILAVETSNPTNLALLMLPYMLFQCLEKVEVVLELEYVGTNETT